MLPRGARNTWLLLLFPGGGWIVACDDPSAPADCVLPSIVQSRIAPNSGNVLAALVIADARFADSVTVRFGQIAMRLDSAAPAVALRNDSATVPVLGLYPESDYNMQAVAFNSCGSTAGAPMSYRTANLPPDLPSFRASGTDPSPGFVVFASAGYGVAIDNTGRVAWYHKLSPGSILNFQAQPNGRYTARPASVNGEQANWLEFDRLGRLTRTLSCARGLSSRLHDIIAQPDGSYWLLCDEIRTVDLSGFGAAAQTMVLGTAVQHISSSGAVLFDWSPFDHLEIDLASLQPLDKAGSIVNWTHGNALDLDGDGNLLLSFRNPSEVLKIEVHSGNVLWRMGGPRNQFTFENVATPAFARQHGLRSTGAGRLVLLDNLGDPLGSHYQRYEYDEARRTVRQTASYMSSTRAIALTGGTTQPLSGERTLVSFGSGGSVQEFDAGGKVVWSIVGNPGYVFRAQRIRSLYEPGKGDPR